MSEQLLARYRFTRGSTLGILFFLLLLPVALFAAAFFYQALEPGNNIVGVGKQTVRANRATLEITAEDGTASMEPSLERQPIEERILSLVRDSLVAMGIPPERIISGGDSWSPTLTVVGFKADEFGRLADIKTKIEAKDTRITAIAHYLYDLTPEVKLEVLNLGLAEAARQAEAIAKSQGHSISRFNGSLCGIQIIDANETFNPSTCDDRPYSDADTNPQKEVVGIVSADVYLSLFR